MVRNDLPYITKTIKYDGADPVTYPGSDRIMHLFILKDDEIPYFCTRNIDP